MKVFVLSSPSYAVRPIGPYPVGWRTRASARKALRAEVKASATRCRQRYGRAGVIKHSPDDYEIRIGNRQGYHLWQRLMIKEAPRGICIERIEQ